MDHIKTSRRVLIVRITAVILLIGLIRYLNLPAYVDPLLDWIKGLGGWSPLFFAALFVLTGGILLPMPLLMMSAGAIYGVLWGTVLISTATVVEGYLLYRIAARFETRLRGSQLLNNKYFTPIQRMLRDGGWRMIGLLRCLPYMSFVFLSFVCGVSRLNMRQYLAGTWLGMIPVSLTYVYIGAVTRTALGRDAADAQTMLDKVVMYAGLALAVGISVYVTRKANKYMKDHEPELAGV